MPRTCSVPLCNSNYRSSLKENPKIVQAFAFPFDDPDRCQKWRRAICRGSFVPTKNSAVCIHHFHEKYIVRVSQRKKTLGQKLKFPYLTKDAVPSIFLNRPSYIANDLLSEREDPNNGCQPPFERNGKFGEWQANDRIQTFQDLNDNGVPEPRTDQEDWGERHQELVEVERNETESEEWQAEDRIQSLQDLSDNDMTKPQVARKILDEKHQTLVERNQAETEEWRAEDRIQGFQDLSDNYHSKNLSNFSSQIFPEFIYFYKIYASLNSIPQISCGVKIFTNLKIQAHGGNAPFPISTFKSILNTNLQCTHWSKFEMLLSHLSSLETPDSSAFQENMEDLL